MKTKERRHTKDNHQQFTFPFLFTSTDNKIGYTGATSLSESLKSNTTLTELDLSREDKIKKTYKRHPLTIHSSFLFNSTDNEIGYTGATSLSESLKSNTTLTALYLSGEDKRKKTHKRHPSTSHSFPFSLFTPTGNDILGSGTASLSESLKSNTTITKLNLWGQCKRRHKKTSINNSLFSFLFTTTGNEIGDTGATSLSKALKSNTTLTELSLGSEDKRKKAHKRHPSTIHSFIHKQLCGLLSECH